MPAKPYKNPLRTEHFKFFKSFKDPVYSVTIQVKIQRTWTALRATRVLTPLISHALASAANQIENFRVRYRKKGPVIWDVLSPSITLIDENGLFKFVEIPWIEGFGEFLENYRKIVPSAKKRPGIFDPKQKQDDVLYMTCTPWFGFTSLTHPIASKESNTVPRIAWGQVQDRGTHCELPLNLQLDHTYIDAVHVGKYLSEFETAIHRNLNSKFSSEGKLRPSS